MPNGSSGQKATCARRRRVCLPSTVDIGRQFSQVGFGPDADLLPFLGLEITRPVEIGNKAGPCWLPTHRCSRPLA
jgi:hypothetical protein